jgi:YbbR domain-containing protein
MKTLRASLLRLALAAGLSFALWAFVSFSQNPEEQVTFPEMPLQVVGLGEDLVIVDNNGLPSQVFPPIEVTLRTDQRQLATLRQVDVRVVANLDGLGPGEHIVPINVEATRSNIAINVPSGGVDPAVVPIRLEQLSTQSAPIRVEIQGNLPFSFERGEPRVSSGGQPLNSVTVSGPLSRVLRVTEARALVNIDQLRATYVAPLALTALDAAGQPVEGVRLEPATVTVQVPINPVVGLKLVPVEPRIIGLPAPGFEVRAVQVSPPLISLAGSSGPLDAVDVLTTAPLDLAGARQTVRASLPISFPEGTSPREGEPDTVSVTVEIATIERLFQAQLPAQVQLSSIGAGLTATANPGVVNVTVAGSSAALADLAQTSLRALFNLDGLGPGVYTLSPQVDLPTGVSLVGEPPTVEVTLRAPPPPPTTAPTPTENALPSEPTSLPEPPAEVTAIPEPTPPPEPPTEAVTTPTPTP